MQRAGHPQPEQHGPGAHRLSDAEAAGPAGAAHRGVLPAERVGPGPLLRERDDAGRRGQDRAASDGLRREPGGDPGLATAAGRGVGNDQLPRLRLAPTFEEDRLAFLSMERLLRWYQRRIVNVNVNIIAAGILALGITVGVMHTLDRTFHFGNKAVISGLTFVVDLIADVAVYYLLHWVANHMPRQTERIINPAYADMSFLKDASLVQFERALLSPLLYIIALGT